MRSSELLVEQYYQCWCFAFFTGLCHADFNTNAMARMEIKKLFLSYFKGILLTLELFKSSNLHAVESSKSLKKRFYFDTKLTQQVEFHCFPWKRKSTEHLL